MTAIIIRKPQFALRYLGTDITRAIEGQCLSFTYIDRLHAQSPELEIRLENIDRRWMGDWLPSKGDKVTATIGYRGGDTLDCGSFEFDDGEFSGSPDEVRLGFLATDVTKDLRTKKTLSYEKTTLQKIAQDIAERNSLTLVGEIPKVTIDRATQNDESDLEFLTKLAEEYDLLVKIENSNLVFYSWEELEARPIIATLDNFSLNRYRFPWKSDGVYKQAELKYQDPSTKTEITHTEVDPDIKVGDTLKLSDRVESRQQAIQKCKAALQKANRKQVEASISPVEGLSIYRAGCNINLSGYGKFSGKYQIMEAKHSLTKSQGWRSDLTVRKIDRIPTG